MIVINWKYEYDSIKEILIYILLLVNYSVNKRFIRITFNKIKIIQWINIHKKEN